MWAILSALQARLDAIPGVATCKIGIETGLSPADYPIIRIIPSKSQHASMTGRIKLDVMIYYGMALAESDSGLGAVYQALAEMEALIIAALEDHNSFTAIWQETITDEDRLDHYKLFMSRFVVTG